MRQDDNVQLSRDLDCGAGTQIHANIHWRLDPRQLYEPHRDGEEKIGGLVELVFRRGPGAARKQFYQLEKL